MKLNPEFLKEMNENIKNICKSVKKPKSSIKSKLHKNEFKNKWEEGEFYAGFPETHTYGERLKSEYIKSLISDPNDY